MRSVNDHKQGAVASTTFRSSMTSREGLVPSHIVQGRVVGLNFINRTVDVVSLFDRQYFFDIQVSGPYLHYANGEGFSIFPDVGAICTVCLPSDSSPPFVAAFLMPVQKLDDVATADAPQGTSPNGGPVPYPAAASFAGGRPRPKPGDMMWTGRDGNFVILHRGGVLQLGATELAQRIFIPLDNRVLDISENYAHHNTGGSIVWGIQDGAGQANFPTYYVETFRVYANDKFADVRVTKGKVPSPLGGAGGLSGDVVYEVAISPKGFNADSGDAAGTGTAGGLVYHVAVDRAGNTSLTVGGQVTGRFKRPINLAFDDDVSIATKKNLALRATDSATLDGGKLTVVKGEVVLLGQGTRPVAREDDLVVVSIGNPLPANGFLLFTGPMPPAPPPTPFGYPITLKLLLEQGGSIVSGNPLVKA